MNSSQSSVEQCVDYALQQLGNTLNIATPLGLGKPNQLLNAFYQRALANPAITLNIMTALSLERPRASSDLEAKLLDPFVCRLFGDYERLDYVQAQRDGSLPANITVSEFYIKAGSMKNVLPVQCNYISTNYTFAARDILARGANLLLQLVSEENIDGVNYLSLSCNTDVTLDLLPAMRASGRPVLGMAQVHNDLPFMVNEAMVEQDYFDVVVRNSDYDTTLFSTPNMSVPDTDYMLGLHASTLVKDGGTLQIGIGALGDAITYACLLRQQDNAKYQSVVDEAGCNAELIQSDGGTDVFNKGLYGCSEMFVNGFLHLLRGGILKRKVYADPGIQGLLDAGLISDAVDEHTLAAFVQAGLVNEPLSQKDQDYLHHWGVLVDGKQGSQLKHGVVMHGGFFLGPKDFYAALREMPAEERQQVAMSSVRTINRLDQPALQSLQRRHARFINTGMMVTLSGAIVSDGLENGQVVSGVGGQYNFVAQAHELADARSIICIRSTRGSGRTTTSNIVASYGHSTVPRHLRDILITEYGAVDLRGRTDSEVVKAILSVTDSRFQGDLLQGAIAAGKIEPGYVMPQEHCNNTPEQVSEKIVAWRTAGLFPKFPLGSDFTDEEIALGASLRELKQKLDSPVDLIKASLHSLLHDSDEDEASAYLQRIGLDHPDTPKEILFQQLLLVELEEQGYLKPL